MTLSSVVRRVVTVVFVAATGVVCARAQTSAPVTSKPVRQASRGPPLCTAIARARRSTSSPSR
jgi:hypothetical protein